MDYHAVLERKSDDNVAVVFSQGNRFISGWDKSMITRVNFSDERGLVELVNEFDSAFIPLTFRYADLDGGKKATVIYACGDPKEALTLFARYFVGLSERNKTGLRVEC